MRHCLQTRVLSLTNFATAEAPRNTDGRDNDMFAGIRGDSSEGNLMGPTFVALCCACCCGCIFLSLIIAFYVWAIVALTTSAPSTQSECGKLHFVWEYCITVVVIMPILGIVVNVIVASTQAAGLAAIPTLIGFAVAVWGVVIWATLGECDHFYTQSFPDLLLLFKIYVVFFIIILAVGLCILVRTRRRKPRAAFSRFFSARSRARILLCAEGFLMTWPR